MTVKATKACRANDSRNGLHQSVTDVSLHKNPTASQENNARRQEASDAGHTPQTSDAPSIHVKQEGGRTAAATQPWLTQKHLVKDAHKGSLGNMSHYLGLAWPQLRHGSAVRKPHPPVESQGTPGRPFRHPPRTAPRYRANRGQRITVNWQLRP
jgi:hypothetical protein